MALPSQSLMKWVVGGAVTSDTWSIGFWLDFGSTITTPSPAQMNAATLAVLNEFNNDVWNNATASLKSSCNTGTTLATARSELYTGGVIQASGAASITPVGGTVATGNPNYTARVVTLLTDLAGRSRRGRVYLPFTGQSTNGGTGLWLTAATMLGHMVTFLDSLAVKSPGGFPGGPAGNPAVVSRTHGYSTPITSLRMDNKPDTQHGRDNKLVATVFDAATL